MPMPKDAIALNPNDEFEKMVIDLVLTHRAKSVAYGSHDDTLNNFYDVATMMVTDPLTAAETLKAKHEARLLKWRMDGRPADSPGVDDAYLDITVYALICRAIYLRGDW